MMKENKLEQLNEYMNQIGLAGVMRRSGVEDVINKCMEYEKIEIDIEQLTGYTFEQLKDMFASGYTLEPPKEQKFKKYGFAEYETWNLDFTFYAWLYEQLKMYLKYAEKIVDLNYHKFEFEGKEHTQRELIDKMVYGCEIALKSDGFYFDLSKEDCKAVGDVAKIWAIVISEMWW